MPADKKETHADVRYRPAAHRSPRRCGNCTMFREPTPISVSRTPSCTAVVAPIRPDDVCDLFELKRGPRSGAKCPSYPDDAA